MANNINALLGMGLSPQDDMKAMANSLRGDQAMGDYYAMSTLAPIARHGQAVQQRTNDAAQRGGVLRQTMQNEATRQEELAAEKERVQGNFLSQAVAKKDAAKLLADEKASKRKTEPYWHPSKKGEVLNLRQADDGRHYDQDGIEYNAQSLTPYEAGQEGSKQSITAKKYADEKVQGERDSLLGEDVISSAISSPLMTAATGKFYDPVKQLGKYTGLFPDVQSQQNVLREVSLKAAAPTLAKLGVNPTDKDLAVAFESVPSESDEPRVWIDWYKNRYMPKLLSGVINGQNPEMAQQLREEMTGIIAEAEAALKQETDKPFNFPQSSLVRDEQPAVEQPGANPALEDALKMYGG